MKANKAINNYLPEIFYLNFFRKRPSAVTINLTNKCNQHCIYCEVGVNLHSSRMGELSIEDIKWVIDEMHKNGIKKLALCGGEPFLFIGLLEIIEYAGIKGVNCSVTTNGMSLHMLGDTDFEIISRNKTQINISIDSFEEAMQTFIRGNNIALQSALLGITKLKEKNIMATLLCTVSKHNFKSLHSYFIQAYELGIKQVLFQPVIYHSNFPDRAAIINKASFNVEPENSSLLMSQLKMILDFERNHAIRTNVYRLIPWILHYTKFASKPDKKWFFEGILKRFYCRDIHAIIDISYDGGIQPCGLTLASSSIHENRKLGLLQMWLNATKKIKKDIDNGNYYVCCNACCHHFSRNMIASVIKYPIRNFPATLSLFFLLISRSTTLLIKKLKSK